MPAGLMLGALCALHGLRPLVVEQRHAPVTHSRSIGIQSPSLALFEQIGLLNDLLDAGNRINTGTAYLEATRMGDLHFSRQPVPHPYIVTCPQLVTERLLEARLNQLAPGALRRAHLVEHLDVTDAHCTVRTRNGTTFVAPWCFACDGHDSFIRTAAGIPVTAHAYPDSYLMGDFDDPPGTRDTAAVHLCRDGLVESL